MLRRDHIAVPSGSARTEPSTPPATDMPYGRRPVRRTTDGSLEGRLAPCAAGVSCRPPPYLASAIWRCFPQRLVGREDVAYGRFGKARVIVAVLVVILFWGAIFLVVLAIKGQTPLESLLGRYEDLPDDLGTWRETGPEDPSGVREERLLLPPAGAEASYLLRQVRYRHPVTREIVGIEPERRVRRRRRKAV